jgi:hypothetical protein
MNRSILIVICDFLLVSLLVFSNPDINRVTDGGLKEVKFELSTNQPDSGKDMTAVMRLALNEERKNRDALLGELTRTREAAAREQTLRTEREQQVQTIQQQLQAREQEATQLQQQQASLQQQFGAAQTNIQALQQQLQSTSAEATLSKERAAAMEADIRKQLDQSATLQKQLGDLQRSNLLALAERERLTGQLQVAEAEKRAATAEATRAQEEVKAEREHSAVLAEGVKTLANKSGELAQEIRENRPLASNTIFSDFLTNRVEARFAAVRAGMFGDSTKTKDTETVLLSNGTNLFALCHIQDTPLTLFNPGTDWEGLTGSLMRNGANVPIRSTIFSLTDPRIVLMPVTQKDAHQLGSRIYHISSDPYKFQDAVLVGARDGYYGECKFEIDPSTPQYVRLDHNVIKGLFGKFNPSRGDFVFSRTGELLGVMANGSYCLMLQNFDGAAAFRFGPDVREQHTGAVLSQLYTMVTELPSKLQ